MLIKISLQEAQCFYGTVFTVNFLGPILNLYGTKAVYLRTPSKNSWSSSVLDDRQEKYEYAGPAFVDFYPVINLEWQAAKNCAITLELSDYEP